MAKEVEIGDEIFSKNGTEFTCYVFDIDGGMVTVRYNDNYEEFESLPKSNFKHWMGDCWDMPNWTFNFEQL